MATKMTHEKGVLAVGTVRTLKKEYCDEDTREIESVVGLSSSACAFVWGCHGGAAFAIGGATHEEEEVKHLEGEEQVERGVLGGNERERELADLGHGNVDDKVQRHRDGRHVDLEVVPARERRAGGVSMHACMCGRS